MNPYNFIKYLFQSTNQHGIHSPFVYNLVTKALYKRKNIPEHPLVSTWKKDTAFNNRKHKIINRALIYFNDNTYKTGHENAFRSEKTIYFNLKKTNPETIFNKTTTHSFFIIDNINASMKQKAQWLKIKESTNFHISLDFYNIGFLFVRKEQVKESFKIRI